MPGSWASLTSLLAGTAVLLVGHGLQLTLLPLRANGLGWTAELVGFTGSAYFAGFIGGCFVVPKLVGRVGHVRVFMVLTAASACALLGIALTERFEAWMLLRFATGFAISGLYLVIESWLNEQTPNDRRGTVLSSYTVIVLVSMVAGQLMVNVANPSGFEIVVIATLFLILATMPIGLSRAPAPSHVAVASFSPRKVLRASRVAIGGSFISGMVSGAFFTLAPVHASNLGHEVSGVALLMAVGIAGGALFQLPLGRLSDRVDRARVLALTLAAGVGACLIGAAIDATQLPLALLVFALFGSTVMPIYPLCLAIANDGVEESFLEVGTGILMMNAMGSMVGPAICASAMTRIGAQAFFGYAALLLLVGVIWVLALSRRQAQAPVHHGPFLSTPKTTPGAIEMDPRSLGEQAV